MWRGLCRAAVVVAGIHGLRQPFELQGGGERELHLGGGFPCSSSGGRSTGPTGYWPTAAPTCPRPARSTKRPSLEWTEYTPNSI